MPDIRGAQSDRHERFQRGRAWILGRALGAEYEVHVEQREHREFFYTDGPEPVGSVDGPGECLLEITARVVVPFDGFDRLRDGLDTLKVVVTDA